jgi:chromosome segregation ATPase
MIDPGPNEPPNEPATTRADQRPARPQQPRNALRRLKGAHSDAGAAAGPFSMRLRLRDYLLLRPHGRRLLTPAAAAWIGSAWVVILLMASIEGFVWGAVGLSLVPAATSWLGPPIALFMFALMFSVIWIVDASLIMSEKPRRAGQGIARAGPLLRWLAGLLVRVAIVAISLYVTAPFIEKLIRADDIAAWHQAQIERYYTERAERLREEVEARATQLDAGYSARIDALEEQRARLDEAVASEQQRRERIAAEYRPEIEVLTQDLAEARKRVGDEVLGRDGRPEGYGPEARKWDARAERLAETLETKRAELGARLQPIEARIEQLRQQIDARNQALADVRAEEQALLGQIRAEVEAEQPPAAPPELTFAARSKALDALRESPAEQGVPHFETVEGFAQAALGILFFALIALKLFEPPSVTAYYSEAVQTLYRRYLDGGLAHIPGFSHDDDPSQRLSPTELAQRWEEWQRDPDGFVKAHRQELDARANLERLDADLAHERELLARRRDGIDHQLALEHRQREAQLRVREQEMELRLAQLGERLADETQLQRERDNWSLERERQQQEEAASEAQRARREQRLNELQQRLERHRTRRLSEREQQLALARRIADNRQAASATEQRMHALASSINANQPSLDQLRDDLETLERQRASSGGRRRFGRLAARARRLRRAIDRRERALAPERDRLEEQRGRLALLDEEYQELQRELDDRRAAEDELQRRCADERAALDALLLAPPPADPPTEPGAPVTSA